jgi:uncharacterized membrane protein
MAKGPVQYVIIGFEGTEFRGEALKELVAATEKGIIRIIDIVVVKKDLDGRLTYVEITDADPSTAALEPIMTYVSGMFAQDDIDSVASVLLPGTSAGLLLVEHVWAAGFVDAIVNMNGVLIDSGFVPRDTLEVAEQSAANS